MNGLCSRCKDYSCMGYFQGVKECRDFEPIRNYDRLTNMSPKELAEWINRAESDARYYGPKGKDVWLKWLQQEVDK